MRRHRVMPFVFITIAIIFTAYGIRVMLLHSGSKFYMAWFGLGVFMVILAAAFYTDMFPAAFKRFLFVLLFALIAFVAVTWSCMFSAFRAEGKSHLDYIIVLGAQVRPSGPSRVLQYRLDAACDYLRANPGTRCIVSGGRGPNEPEAEGTAMKEYLVGKGIEEARIITETDSANTVQNLVNSGKLINLSDRVGIVTNNFHVFRAVHIAKKKGYKNVCGIAAPSNYFYLPNNMLRESFGIVKDLAMRNM